MAKDSPYQEFCAHLSHGVPAALRFLNSRTPHRFTGVYRYDGDMLRNMALHDRFNPDLLQGIDIPLCNAYCSNVRRNREPLEFDDAKNDSRFPYLPGSPVVCYSGVLISMPDGTPYGTLCHYDVKSCESRESDMPLLQACAPNILKALQTRQALMQEGT